MPRKPRPPFKDSKVLFKLQRPLMTNGDPIMVLIYNKDESIQGQVPLTNELMGLFRDDLKIFMRGTYSHGIINLDGTRVPDPHW